MLLLDLYVVVGGALVDHLYMEVFVAQNLVFDSPRVPKARLLANVVEDFRILRENHLHQELLREGECFDRSLSDVHELGLRVAHKVVVAKEA